MSEGTIKNRYQLYRVAKDFGGYDPQIQAFPPELNGLPADYYRRLYPYWLDQFADGDKRLSPDKAKQHLAAAAHAKSNCDDGGGERYSADRMVMDVVRDVGNVAERQGQPDEQETDT